MNDIIYRNQAIEAISKLPVKVDNLGYTWMIAGDVLKQIDDIPSVEPEQKKGKWIGNKYMYYCCSECGHEAYWDASCTCQRLFDFCPFCGSDMRG